MLGQNGIWGKRSPRQIRGINLLVELSTVVDMSEASFPARDTLSPSLSIPVGELQVGGCSFCCGLVAPGLLIP